MPYFCVLDNVEKLQLCQFLDQGFLPSHFLREKVVFLASLWVSAYGFLLGNFSNRLVEGMERSFELTLHLSSCFSCFVYFFHS